MKILHLTIKKQWFDMIASGRKREEYREIKRHWNSRLLNRDYDAVCFRNGYSKDSPKITVELKCIRKGYGLVSWGAPSSKLAYVIELGEILSETI